MLPVEPMKSRIGAVDPDDPRAQPSGAHEPRNPAPTDGTPLRLQRAMNSGTAVGPAVLPEAPVNPPLHVTFSRRFSRSGSHRPGRVCGSRHAVPPTERRHTV